ncbi:MAG TPA: hypothetical protein VGU90_04765 [Terriglobales bacterium]|nr:hypothetical protein [Terriglobales bacterium]
MRTSRLLVICIVPVIVAGSALAQTCFTSEDMDAATRSAVQAAGSRYFDMVARADIASLKQNSIPSVASNFGGIEQTIKENQSNLVGAHATPRDPFVLKAEGTAPLPKAEFLCGIFGANGQTKNSAEFSIPNLPPGTYGIAIMDVPTQKSGYTLAFVLQQQGTDWKIAGFFLRPTQILGHDSNWFLDRARAFKAKGQTHNAWLYFVEGRDLAMPVPFMYTQNTDKLYDEVQSVKPADFPINGNPADLTAANGKTYKLIALFPLVVQDDLDLVVKYQTADVSNSGQTFQENMNVMKALVTKFPELRDAFQGLVCRAVEPSGKDYGSLMPMKDIK